MEIHDQSRSDWIPIESKSGGSRRTQDIPLKSLNSFTIQSRVKKIREEHQFLKEISPENLGPFDPVTGGIDSHDRTMIVGH